MQQTKNVLVQATTINFHQFILLIKLFRLSQLSSTFLLLLILMGFSSQFKIFLCMKQTFTFFSQFNFLNTHITQNSPIEQQVTDLNN